MASKKNQIQRTNRSKDLTERHIVRALTPWLDNIVADWRVGTSRVSEISRLELEIIIGRQLVLGANRILGFDIRDSRKQIEEDVKAEIAATVTAWINLRLPETVSSITDTVEKRMVSVNGGVATDEISPAAAKTALKNHLRSQRLVIAVTESEAVTELSKQTAVLTVNEPLKNSVDQVIALVEAGDSAGARRLSREIIDMAKLPLSVSQGQFVRGINSDIDRLVTPLGQAQAAARMRARAEELGTPEKEWVTIGDMRVRASHVNTNGQKRVIDEPFTLEGGEMQHPGDGSLGASLSEIIGCRCAAAYI